LRLMAQGHSNGQIADDLHLSQNTVRTHAANIYTKLSVETAREAIAWAWKSGLMSRDA